MSSDLQKEEVIDNKLTKIEKEVTEELIDFDPKIFDAVPKNKRPQLIRGIAMTVMKAHSGPLPDPETLERYSVLIPNGAERIMQMAEKQQNHRMGLESRVIDSQLRQSNTGQILAFVIGLAALGAGAFCIYSGHELGGSVIGGGGIVGLVTAFIKGRSAQERNLETKNPK